MTYPSFSVGETLRAADMNAVSSWLIKSETFSAQDPYDLTSVFSSSYRNYKIYMDVFGSTSNALSAQFLSGTSTPYTSADYYRYGFYVGGSGSYTGFSQATQTNMFLTNLGTTSTQRSPIEITVFTPNETQRTYVFLQSFDPYSGLMIQLQHQCATTTAFTGMRFDPASGSVSGHVRVYGLKD